jgi:hypothetical protein
MIGSCLLDRDEKNSLNKIIFNLLNDFIINRYFKFIKGDRSEDLTSASHKFSVWSPIKLDFCKIFILGLWL